MALGQLEHLTELSLGGEPIDHPPAASLFFDIAFAEMCKNLTKLEKLSLSLLHSMTADSLYTIQTRLPRLKKLDLPIFFREPWKFGLDKRFAEMEHLSIGEELNGSPLLDPSPNSPSFPKLKTLRLRRLVFNPDEP